MEIDKKTKEKINDLQLMEQKLQSFLIQKQSFQVQLLEVENALAEIKLAKGSSYKIVGTIMVETKKEDLTKDLEDKKEVLDLRIKTLEKQEEKIKKEASELQKEIMKVLEK